jgi:3',5'-cyclic AMP phosphodiesterase CpdA
VVTPDRLILPGLHRPVRIYHFADTHLQAGAETDPQIPRDWKSNRSPVLPLSDRNLLLSHLNRACDGGADVILACGDLCHFPSRENAELISSLFRDGPLPVWTLPGNHDWFYPGQDGWEELRAAQLPRLAAVYGDTPEAGCHELHGFRLISLDNSTYFLSSEQLAFLEAKLETDLPVLVAMHIPLSTPALRKATVAKHGSPILMADPEGRTRADIDPEPTRRAAELLRTHPAIHAVLSAHVHLPFREDIAPGRPQLIPEAGYRNGFRWIDCLPRE